MLEDPICQITLLCWYINFSKTGAQYRQPSLLFKELRRTASGNQVIPEYITKIGWGDQTFPEVEYTELNEFTQQRSYTCRLQSYRRMGRRAISHSECFIGFLPLSKPQGSQKPLCFQTAV